MNYTIAEHSGLGRGCVEPYAVGSARDVDRIRSAGGVVVPDYALAEAVAEYALSYEDGGIAPSAVRGTFSTSTWRGVSLLVPDANLSALLAVAEANEWDGEVSDWAVAARALGTGPSPASSPTALRAP